jgi:hypothetical protein
VRTLAGAPVHEEDAVLPDQGADDHSEHPCSQARA